jgi:hypothetical protein
VDAHIGQDSIERCGELAGPVSDKELELSDAIAKIHDQVAELLGGSAAVGVGVVPRTCPDRLATSRTTNTEIRWSVTAQSTGKKSQASMVDAGARRNCRQLVSVHRSGAGGSTTAGGRGGSLRTPRDGQV